MRETVKKIFLLTHSTESTTDTYFYLQQLLLNNLLLIQEVLGQMEVKTVGD